MSIHAVGRHLLRDQSHREQRREVVRADRLLGAPGAAAVAAARAGRAARCTRPSGSASVGRSNRAIRNLRVSGAPRGRDQRAASARGILGPHERLAHEHRVEAGRGHPHRVVRGADRTLGDRDRRPAEMRGERRGDVEVLGERAEVAGVRRRRSGASSASARSSSAASWASTSTPRPRPVARSAQLAHVAVVGQGGEDQQDRVGADRAGLVDLHLVDREVLAQHRNRARVPSRLEIGDRTSEVRRVGEDAQRRRAARGVGRSERGGIQVRGEVALRRRPALDLGDETRMAVGATQGGGEVTRRAARRAPDRGAGRASAAGGER